MLRSQAWELLKVVAFTERLKLRRTGTVEPLSLYQPAIFPGPRQLCSKLSFRIWESIISIFIVSRQSALAFQLTISPNVSLS
jgi:hypothetical protein